MASKSAADSVLDEPLDRIATGVQQIACSAEPLTYAEATVTYKLSAATMVAGTDYTKSNGTVDGRKVTLAAKSGVAITATGDATHVAIVDGTTLLYVTTCTTQTLTNGNTLNFPTWSIEFADPT